MTAKVGRPIKTIRNPFIFSDKIKTNRLEVVGNVSKFKKNNGESSFDTYTVDRNKNAIHISEDLLIQFSKKGANTTETAIFLYILSKLYYGKGQIELDPEKISDETGHSIPRIYRALGSLSKAEIIGKQSGRKNRNYWIHPFKIFQGNRVNYIKKYAKDEQEINTIIHKIEKKEKSQLEAMTE